MSPIKRLFRRRKGIQVDTAAAAKPWTSFRSSTIGLGARSITVADNFGDAGNPAPTTESIHTTDAVIQDEIAASETRGQPTAATGSNLIGHWAKTAFFCANFLHPVLRDAKYSEMWGVTLKSYEMDDVPTQIIVGKFLSACNYDVNKAAQMLKNSLIWRSQKNPRVLMHKYHAEKFKGLGYITSHERLNGGRVVVTWNLWRNKCNAKQQREITKDIEEYLEWRIALIEMEIDEIGIAAATALPQLGDQDPFRSIQVHDFSDFSFATVNFLSNTKAIAAGLKIFSVNYPEMVFEKDFVGMPFAVVILMRAIKGIVPDAFANARTVKQTSSLARKYLPEIVGGYPIEFNTGATAIRVSAQSVYQGRTPLYESDKQAGIRTETVTAAVQGLHQGPQLRDTSISDRIASAPEEHTGEAKQELTDIAAMPTPPCIPDASTLSSCGNVDHFVPGVSPEHSLSNVSQTVPGGIDKVVTVAKQARSPSPRSTSC